MSSQNRPESHPGAGDAIDGRDIRQQPEPHSHDAGNDDGTHRAEHGTSAEGGYREQDYGGEPSNMPTEHHES